MDQDVSTTVFKTGKWWILVLSLLHNIKKLLLPVASTIQNPNELLYKKDSFRNSEGGLQILWQQLLRYKNIVIYAQVGSDDDVCLK
jgi:hypothetical protein